MEKARHIITTFLKTLSFYDYIGFFLSLFIFILFIVLALMLRKHTKRSLFLLFLGFTTLFAGPVMIHKVIKNTLFLSEVTLSEMKQLHYSDTLLIKGKIDYKGKKEANHCEIKANIYKQGANVVKDFVYKLKAYRSGKQKIDKLFSQGDSENFKIVIEPFRYQGDYNMTLESGCYL